MSEKSSKIRNKPITEALVEMGLTSKEATIYIASLKLDSGGTISEISDLCDLPRTTCYPLIQSLVNKHFMDNYVMGKKKIYCPTNPDHLIDFVNSKVKKFEETIPLLKAVCGGGTPQKPRVALYEGIEKMLTVRQDLLSGKYKLARTITPIEKLIKLFSPELIKKYIKKRGPLGLKSKLITSASPVALKWKENDDQENRITKLIPNTDVLSLNSMLMIYGDKFVIMDIDGDRPFALEITSPQVTKTAETVFDLLWDKL